MSNTNPARGMRDFLPVDVRKREYVINIIKEVYESYGFEPLETPAVENIETLTNKYGEEGNRLIFKILKRGEKLEQGASEKELADLALRYDLTVPLARVAANYKNDLPKFFKRYQIQPVWRADRPARGRFREFYQCDVDAIGSSSMIVEAELCAAVSEILERLGFEDFFIRLNHREVLRGMLDVCGIEKEKQTDVLVALDKLDKIGQEGVLRELEERKVFTTEAKNKLFGQFLDLTLISLMKSLENPETQIRVSNEAEFKGLNTATFEKLSGFIGENESGQRGILALKEILSLVENTQARGKIEIDPNLARGLSYYNGAIFEIVLFEGFSGSIGGGGRYDGLIGMFGKEQIPACGFSLGLERILFVMDERNMFPADLQNSSADVLVTIWNKETIAESVQLANDLRSQGLRVLLYPEADKLGKQFKYADSINVPFVCILGETELTTNKVTLKNMETGEQETIERGQASEKIKK
ncbi:histidine--tRNA ligase [soil metagenome]